MNKARIALVFVIGMFVGVVSATTLEMGKIGFTKDGMISYLNQACAE